MYDVLVKGARIVDGTGAASWVGDVAVRDRRIAAMGQLEGEAATVIDGLGLVIAPGFIDIHTHSDISFLLDPGADGKVRQGVTLEVTGNCGMSTCFPLHGQAREYLDGALKAYGVSLDTDWKSFGGWLERLEQRRSTVNLATLIGHNTVRAAVIGYADRGPTPEELAAMGRIVAESLDEGAIGFSTGLFYPPGSYARTEEVMALAKEAGKRGKLYATHIRDEAELSVGLLCAAQEAIEIGRASGARVEIAHMKCGGPAVWGRADQYTGMLERARREGVDVAGDQYPYEWGSTWLSSTLFPRWAAVGGWAQSVKNLERKDFRERLLAYVEAVLPRNGGEDGIVITSFPPDRSIEGKSIGQIAMEREVRVPELVIDLYREHDPETVVHMMQEADVETIAHSPWTSVGSDGSSLSAKGVLAEGKPHPRNYGCFPRHLARFVRERKLFSLEEAVRKMTSLPASRLGLTRRGRLQPGYWADFVVFDPATVRDTATFQSPHQYPVGIPYVAVNGELAVNKGQYTGATPGRVIRGAED